MWIPTSSLLAVCGLLSASFTFVRGGPISPNAKEIISNSHKDENRLPTEKYFTESSMHYHYDSRFTKVTLSTDEVTPHLSALIQTYLRTMSSIGAETWIMHGTLLGWWWNQKIFPWDNDLDVQVSEPTIQLLAEHHNMTEYRFEFPGVKGSRSYLLDINPNYVVRSTKDQLNKIDGRWIDMSTGLFIDITAVRRDDQKRESGQEGALICKDKHTYEESQIFPLRDSYFEGVPVKIPYAYIELLEDEYSPRSLTNTRFHGRLFNQGTKIWDDLYPR